MKIKNLILIALALGLVFSWGEGFVSAQEEEDYKILREIIVNEFQKETPFDQGVDIPGVVKRFSTPDKKIAIALEACFETGADVDTALLKALEDKKISAALFTDQAWLQKNSETIKPFLDSGQLTLENHGSLCRPLSVNGRTVKNHAGTAGVEDVFEEVEKNARVIEKFSGRLPHFFKSGYGYYDDVALKIVNVLGYQAVEGDLKLRAKDVASASALQSYVAQMQPGSVMMIPVNRPGTSADWMPRLLDGVKQHGYAVTALDDVLSLEENKS